MYCPIHPLTRVADLKDSHTPAMIDMMAMTWEMNPLRNPWTNAGTKQIKRMISSMFIIVLKCLYLQFE